MAKSKIEWLEGGKVWNPVTGCTRVSPGCDNCYAIRQSHRFSGVKGSKFEGVTLRQAQGERVDWTGVVRCHEDLLEMPLSWRKPERVFVNSMADLFHDDVPEEFIFKVWKTMLESPRHTYMILTKRPQRMKVVVKKIETWLADTYPSRRTIAGVPLPNVWLGVSCEDQRWRIKRIPHLLNTPAAVRFVSLEPMLGGIDLWQYLGGNRNPIGEAYGGKGLDLVICGGESGPGARPMELEWARSVRDQCVAAGVPFFFKQWGGCGKKRAGRLLDGREWNEFPETSK